ncbi:MAG: glutathione S-transferase family protein [Xanthomonadaceae bacterium]|nr:glutathione S-transferase family protein [Xanthomonadaceae bacterium]
MMPTLKTDTPLLYAAPLSGYSYKVVLTLRLLGMEYALRVVDLSVPRALRPAEFRAVARFDEVPVLLIDGLALCQSNAILEYLARRQSALHEGDESQRLKVREWLAWECERIGLNLAHACAARHFGHHPEAVASWYQARAVEDFSRLAQALADRHFLVGDAPTIADIACFAWQPYAKALGLFVPLPPAVEAWQKRIRALPGFVAPTDAFAGAAP